MISLVIKSFPLAQCPNDKQLRFTVPLIIALNKDTASYTKSLSLSPLQLELGMHFVTMATPMHFIDGKGHTLELRSKRNDLYTVQSVNHATSYLWPWGWTHNTHTHTHVVHVKIF